MLTDTSDVSSTLFLSWANKVANLIYRTIVNVDPEQFITTQNISVVADTSSYALPAGFRNIDPHDTGFFVVDDNGTMTDTRLPRTMPGALERGYYIYGANVVFTPAPTKNETITLRYIPKRTTFTALSDYWTVNKADTGKELATDEYLEMLLDGILTYYHRWDNDPAEESMASIRFQRSLSEYLMTLRKEPKVFSMPDFALNY
jgi:hypothetical protein